MYSPPSTEKMTHYAITMLNYSNKGFVYVLLTILTRIQTQMSKKRRFYLILKFYLFSGLLRSDFHIENNFFFWIKIIIENFKSALMIFQARGRNSSKCKSNKIKL